MKRSQPSLTDLPEAVLHHVLDSLAEENHEQLASPLLACKALRQAGEQLVCKAPLRLPVVKLQQARAAGHEEKLLTWLTKKSQLWQDAVVEMGPLADLRTLLGILAAAGSSNRLRMLEVQLGVAWDLPASCGKPVKSECCYSLPQELEQLKCLTKLSIVRPEGRKQERGLHAADLARLSSLTALQSLKLSGNIAEPLPAVAVSNLQQLTSLELELYLVSWDESQYGDNYQLPGSEHLAACTALRRLHIRGENPVPAVSEQQVLAAWQHLEDLQLRSEDPTAVSFPGTADFCQALLQLPCLTRLSIDNMGEEPSELFSEGLPPHLVSLKLYDYTEEYLPPLPPTLTHLDFNPLIDPEEMPYSPSLRSLCIFSCCPLPEWPESASCMVHLTELELHSCPLTEGLPALVASLPALEVIYARYTMLPRLPEKLACVGSLRRLMMPNNKLTRVPAVLGGGAASRLEHLDLSGNAGLEIDNEGLEILRSLTALTYLYLPCSKELLASDRAGSVVLRKALVAGLNAQGFMVRSSDGLLHPVKNV